MKQFLFLIFVSLSVASFALGSDFGDRLMAPLAGPSGGISPKVAKPNLHPAAPTQIVGNVFDVPLRYDVPKEHMDNLKIKGSTTEQLGGKEIHYDANVGGGALAPSQVTNFNGMAQFGWIP